TSPTMGVASRKAAAKRARRPSAEGPLRPMLLGGLATLLVARPLLPSEGVSWIGDDATFDMLWILIAGAYLLSAIKQGGLARRPTLVDWAVLALVVTCAASALAGALHASPRPAINMLWVWVGFGLVYFLTRELVRGGREARALVALMITLAVVLSSYGF